MVCEFVGAGLVQEAQGYANRLSKAEQMPLKVRTARSCALASSQLLHTEARHMAHLPAPGLLHPPLMQPTCAVTLPHEHAGAALAARALSQQYEQQHSSEADINVADKNTFFQPASNSKCAGQKRTAAAWHASIGVPGATWLTLPHHMHSCCAFSSLLAVCNG